MIILMCAIFFIFLPRDGLQVTGAYAWVDHENYLCKDYWGYFDIVDEIECKAAAKQRGFDFIKAYKSYYPKGCFYNSGRVWFNMPAIGKRQRFSEPICRGESTECTSATLRQCKGKRWQDCKIVSWSCDSYSGSSGRSEGHYDCGDDGDEQNCTYVVLEENKLCGDEGKLDIDENHCKKVAEKRGTALTGFNPPNFNLDNSPNYPKGCFQIANVFFNRHSVGSRQSHSSPICRYQEKDPSEDIKKSNSTLDGWEYTSGVYAWIGKNRLCNDYHKFDIEDKNDCKTAAKERGFDIFMDVSSRSSFPKGCFYHFGGTLVFNRHSVGSRQPDSSPVCRNQAASNCFTVGGNIIGHKCKFPFIYNKWDDYPYVPASFLRWFPNEIKFESCTDFRNSGRLWCATKVTSDNRYIPGNWGECPDSPICRTVRAEFSEHNLFQRKP